MAWTKVEDDPHLDHKESFILDDASDINAPPASYGECAAGSVAYTPDLLNIYQKGNDGNWHKIGG